MARARRFYWLWAVALPLVVGVGVYFLMSDITDRQTMGLGFGVGAAGIVWYVTETYYLRRQEKGKRASDQRSVTRQGSRAGSCKAKRALSSEPRRSIDGASLGKSPEAISARILARSSSSAMTIGP